MERWYLEDLSIDGDLIVKQVDFDRVSGLSHLVIERKEE